MEDGDDDFGDLYADVEVEASSAMTTAPKLSQLQIVSDETGKQNARLEARSDGGGDEDEDDDEDDDDDLKIVLNSDDDSIGQGQRNNASLEDEDDDEEFATGKASGKNGSGCDGADQRLAGGAKGMYNSHPQYKYVRPQSAVYPSDPKGNGCGASASYSYSSPRGDQEDNGYRQRTGSRSMGPQCGQNFSLPRSRTILDVNIDIFERKPWKHPGADITDYFNFGFNEDSWKLYCSELDEYRHRPLSSVNLAAEPAHLTEAYEGGFEHEEVWWKSKSRHDKVVPSMLTIPFREHQPERRKGRAIQVENSIVERRSSMDIKRQVDRDSDVIQIMVQDPGEHCSGSEKGGLGHIDSSAPEASNNGGVSGDDDTDHLSFSSESKDESLEGNLQEMVDAPKRFSSQRSSSKPAISVSENHENHQISDVDEHHHSRTATCGSEGIDEANGTSDNPKETRDPSMIRAESSEAEKSPANHFQAFEDDAYRDKQKSYSHEWCPSTKSFTECTPSLDSDYRRAKDFKRPNDKKNGRYHARQNSPVYKNRKTHQDSKPKAHFENDESFLTSDTEGIHDVHSTVGRDRRTERPRAVDSYGEKNISYAMESDRCSDYYGERFSGYEGSVYRKGYENRGAKMDSFVFRSLEEEEYYGERRRCLKDDEVMARDWYHNERELTDESMDCFAHDELGWKSSKTPPYMKYKRGAQWKRKGDNIRFRNKGEDDEVLERRYADDMRGGKFERFFTYDGRERDNFERKYVKRVCYSRWEVRNPGRKRSSCGPTIDLDDSWPKHDGDRYMRYMEDHSFASRSFKEPHINMMPMNDLNERRDRYRGQSPERFRDNDPLGSYFEPFDRDDYIIDGDHCVDIGRRKHRWQSEMQWDEDETFWRHGDAKSFEEGALFSLEKVSGHERFDAGHGSDRLQGPIDDPCLEGYKYKLRVEGNVADEFDGISNGICGGSGEKPFRGYGNSHLDHGSEYVEELITDRYAEGRKYKHAREVNSGNKFDRTSKIRGRVDSLDSHLVDRSDHVEEPFDDPRAKWHRPKQTRKLIDGYRRNRTSNVIHGKSHEQSSLSYRNSQLVFGEGKSSGRYHQTQDEPEGNVEELETAGLDIEEGQIIAEEVNVGPTKEKVNMEPTKDKVNMEPTKDLRVNDVNGPRNRNGKVGFDERRILEVMAKMEKRKERFKEPITATKTDPDNVLTTHSVDLVKESTSGKQQRPARKRRWG